MTDITNAIAIKPKSREKKSEGPFSSERDHQTVYQREQGPEAQSLREREKTAARPVRGAPWDRLKSLQTE